VEEAGGDSSLRTSSGSIIVTLAKGRVGEEIRAAG